MDILPLPGGVFTVFFFAGAAHEVVRRDRVPTISLNHTEQGDRLHARGDADAAFIAYQKIVAIAPDDGITQFKAGLSAFQARRHLEAETVLHALLKRQPKHGRGHFVLGLIALEAGDNLGAVHHAEIAAMRLPRFADAHALLGTALLRTGDKANAVAAYQNALRVDPANASANASLEQLGITR